MVFSIPLVEEMMGEAAPDTGFPGTGTIDCAGNFSFDLSLSLDESVSVGFSLNGSLDEDGACQGTWAFDFPTLEVDPATLQPELTMAPVTLWFDSAGTFSGARNTEPALVSPVIETSAEGAGTISPAGPVEVASGADQTFTFTPEGGGEVLDVIVNGELHLGPMDSYTFENVSDDQTLVVKFGSTTLWDGIPGTYAGELEGSSTVPGRFMMNETEIEYAPALQGSWEFDLGADGSAVITISGGPPIFLGEEATPVFDDIVGTGQVDTETGAAQMTFTVPTFGEFDGTGQFTSDRQFSFVIPELGYTLSGTLNEDGTVGGLWTFDSSLFFVGFTAGGSFSGELQAAAGDFRVTTTALGDGTISPADTVAVAPGGSQTFTFTPAEGSQVLDVIVNGESQGTLDSYTVDAVDQDVILVVKFAAADLWETIPGVYAGEFQGAVSDPLLFPADGTWQVEVDEATNIISVTVQGPSIMGTFGTITGSGVMDPATGTGELTFQVPLLGEFAGTARFDRDGGFSFDVPEFGFSMSGQTAADQSITGSWDLDATMAFFKVAASGDLTESAKYRDPRTIQVTAGGPGQVLPFGLRNEYQTVVRVEQGETVTLSFSPDAEAGCGVMEVLVDGVSQGQVEEYTFASLAEDHTVTVLFGSESLWDGVPGTYAGQLSGEMAYDVLDSGTQQETVSGSWQFDAGAEGQLNILLQGLPVLGDVVGTGKVVDTRVGYAPMEFTLPGLEALLGELGGQVPTSMSGYGQLSCDGSLEFHISYFGVTLTLAGTLGEGGWAAGTWAVESERLFVLLDGQGTFSTDIDEDGLADGWEVAYGLDPTNPDDGGSDPDNDGLTSAEEYLLGTNPQQADTDGDGLPDNWEVANGTDPVMADADEDLDGDGLINWYEYQGGTDPASPTAGPGIPDPVAPVDGATEVGLTPTLTVDYLSGYGGEAHMATVWQVALDPDFSNLILDVSSDRVLLGLPLDEVLLSPGTGYFWRAQFIDADGRDWRWCQPVFFTVNPAPFADANSNNIPDDQEVTAATDLDGNGVDDAAQTNMARVTALDGSPLGLTTGAGEQSIDALCVTDPDSLPDDPAKPEDIPLGLVSFRVNVEEAGDTATVTIFFSEPLAAGMVWYKYDAVNGWQDFSARAQFADDMTSVTLTLTDGGIGDADGVANGVIVDPSGAAGEVAPGSSSGYESSAGSSCFITTAGRLYGIMK